MNNLRIVKSDNFGSVKCDFYTDGSNEILMTRRQIGESLEYENPNGSVKNIHLRHADRLDKFSTVVQIDTPSRGKQETTVYNAKGIMEICRWSQQPKADEFMDWVWDVIESLRTGQVQLVPTGLQALKVMNEQVGMIIGEVEQIGNKVNDLENNIPLFTVECKELQSLVRKKGTKVLGGYHSPAYCDNSIRGKVYSDIQRQLKREFGVDRYEAIKRRQFESAKQIILDYKAPMVLLEEIKDYNSQIKFQEVS
ncbi:ORF6C domain-containing protein [Wukongibacter sp. M2B1]|uniref:ORF6C domain-containing protein n=1 Tax=Wukongibacter sp. M2B1 TaxID=3088895 RepID=UPI003D7B5A5A